MSLPPAVTIHGLADARTALAPGLPVTLLSGVGAGAYAGAGWWRALVAAAGAPPGTPDILDCADAPGRALEALRLGQTQLILIARPDVWNDIADRAGRQGATLLAARPQSLDLANPRARRQLQAWLAV